jgi:hypothetical protein
MAAGFANVFRPDALLAPVAWLCLDPAETLTSSLRLSPRLSIQEIVMVSPALAPLMRKPRKGFLLIPGPQRALSTGLPLSAATTSVICQAGTSLPAASRRWPLSIS